MIRSNGRTGALGWPLAVAAVLCAAVGAAQPARDYTDDTTPPTGIRGERIRQVLAAITAGEAGRFEALVKDAFGGPFREIPLEAHLNALGRMHDSTGGLDFQAVRRYAGSGPADTVVVIAKNRLTGGWQGLRLSFDGTPQERITGLELLPARPPKGLPPPPPLTADQAKAELDAFLDRLAGAEAFSGTVLLARNGQVVYEAARGIADRNHGVPMRTDSKLNLGSMNKMFTAVVIGQLVDEGRLSFQDPVSKFLGSQGWTKADLSKVRVEHLLSHTSGLGSYFNDTYQRTARQMVRGLQDYKVLVAEDTLAFEPGTRWRYSNTGFLLAGAVIEAVTGRDYFDVVRERIYARAGMPDSDSYDIDLVVPHLAVGYSRERTAHGARWRSNTFAHVIRGGPAGGGYSTARDLLAFAEALRKGTLVGPATAERLWTAKPDLGSPEYGFGFGAATDALGRSVGHSGGFSGISSVLDIYLDSGWTFVVLSNVDDGAVPVAQKLREVAGRIGGPGR
jgi:CubicO group peptidase (beta-lactamase class C family)